MRLTGKGLDRSRMGYLGLWLKGVCMGAADVVPGVSGGTIAFILGIYQELITAIRSFDMRFLRLMVSVRFRDALEVVHWKFLMTVGTGILFAVFSLARLLSWLLHNHPVAVWSFFFGLIAGSLIAVGGRIGNWSPAIPAGILFGAAGTYMLVGIVPMDTPVSPWFLFLSGALAICAMILPGISGAFILVLLGKYLYVLDAVNDRDFFTLALVAGGAVVGLLTFARLLGWLFQRFHDLTMAVLTGLMLGSLRRIWPWKLVSEPGTVEGPGSLSGAPINVLPSQLSPEVILALALALAGFLAVLFVGRRAGSL